MAKFNTAKPKSKLGRGGTKSADGEGAGITAKRSPAKMRSCRSQMMPSQAVNVTARSPDPGKNIPQLQLKLLSTLLCSPPMTVKVSVSAVLQIPQLIFLLSQRVKEIRDELKKQEEQEQKRPPPPPIPSVSCFSPETCSGSCSGSSV